MKTSLHLMLAALIGGSVSYFVAQQTTKNQDVSVVETTAINPQTHFAKTVSFSSNNTLDFRLASKKSMNAVVHITSKQEQNQRLRRTYNHPLFEFFGLPNQGFQSPNTPQSQSIQVSSGSGVIISNDGYIVTNNHVIEGADELEITLHDNRSFSAKVIGTDPSTDIALVKIDEADLPFLEFSNSDQVEVGEWVLAVGNPFRLNSTVTSGIVSAKARNINILKEQNAIESFIQTDAAVNPGNSGGALVNTNGDLIGINTAIASNTGSYTGYAFAVPSNIVSKVVSDLKNFGLVQRAYLGIQIRDVDAKLQEEKALSQSKGVYIETIVENSAAETSGIEAGDIIQSINNQEVSNSAQLMEIIGSKQPGDQLSVGLLREDKALTFNLVLKNKNGDESIIKAEDLAYSKVLGAHFEVTDKGLKINKLNHGLISEQTRIKEGFVINEVDGKPVRTFEELQKILKTKSGGVMFKGFYPGQEGQYYFGLGF
ncbi:MAG: trypsin-like peptidase domain-containing protein [Flavobacteriales bacterium]